MNLDVESGSGLVVGAGRQMVLEYRGETAPCPNCFFNMTMWFGRAGGRGEVFA